MRFSVWVSSGHTWPEILQLSQEVEADGWDAIWISDHFMPPAAGYGNEPELGTDPELGSIHEGWSLVAALAGLVPRIRLGVLVSGNTYRHPAVVAKMAATIDHISGGRHILGLGSGWQKNEHERYGIDYPTPGEFSDRLEEAAAIITSLFDAHPRATFEGTYFRVNDAPLEPKPLQSPMPLLIGGGGERRTIRTAARYATHWNAWGTPETMRHKVEVLANHCREAERLSTDIEVSTNAFLQILTDPAEGSRLREAMGARGGLVGTPDQIRAQIEKYASAGVSEIAIAGFNYPPDEFPGILARFREILGS